MPVAFAQPNLTASNPELWFVLPMSMPSVLPMSMPRAHPVPLPIGWGEDGRRPGEGQSLN